MKDAFGVEHIAKAAHHHSASKLLKEIIGEVAGQGYATTKRRAKKSKIKKRLVYHGTTAGAARKIMRGGFKANDIDAGKPFDYRQPAVYFSNMRAAREYAKPSRNILGFVRSGRVVRAESPTNGMPAFDHGKEPDNPRFHQPWRRTEDAKSLTPKGVIKLPLTRGQIAQNVGIGTAYSAPVVGGAAYAAHKSKVKKRLKPTTLLKWGDGQARSPERVARVKAAIQESGKVDPVAVNIIRGKPHLMNGHHRAIAADDLGFKRIPVRVRFGSYKAWKDPNF